MTEYAALFHDGTVIKLDKKDFDTIEKLRGRNAEANIRLSGGVYARTTDLLLFGTKAAIAEVLNINVKQPDESEIKGRIDIALKETVGIYENIISDLKRQIDALKAAVSATVAKDVAVDAKAVDIKTKTQLKKKELPEVNILESLDKIL